MSARPLGKSALALLAAGLASLLVWMSLSDPDPAGQRPDDALEEPAPDPEHTARDATAQLPSLEPAPQRLTQGATPTFVLRAFDRVDTPLRPGTPDRIATGRVAWATTGLPIARCEITVTRWRLDVVGDESDQGDEVKAPDPALVTWTDEFGRFELRGVPDEDELYLRFRLADGSSDVHELRVPVRAGEPTWQGEYLLEERGTIRGRVVDGSRGKSGIEVRAVDEFRYDEDAVDEDARAARFAGIETFAPHRANLGGPDSPDLRRRDRMLPFPRTLTSPDGTFVLHGVRAGTVQLLVATGTPQALRMPVLVEADRSTDVGEIALSSASHHYGTFVKIQLRDPDGDAARGYQICIEDRSRRLANLIDRTDGRGSARIRIPSPETAERFAAVPPHLRPSPMPIPWEADRFVVHARSAAGRRWEEVGILREPGSNRLRMRERARVDVEFLGMPASLCEQVEVRTTPRSPSATVEVNENVVRVDRIDPQGTVVVLVLPGHAPVLVGDPDSSLSHERITVRPEPTRQAEIRVVDPEGRPWSRARVAVEFRGDSISPHLGPFHLGATDDEGRLESPALWHGDLRFHVKHIGTGHFVEATYAQRDPEAGAIVLTVAPSGRIEGEIVDRGAAAGRRFRMCLRRPDGTELAEPRRIVETTADNRFRFLDVRPGPWTLEVLDPPAAVTGGPRERISHHVEELVVGADRTTALLLDLGRNRSHDPQVTGRVGFGNHGGEGLRISAEDVAVLPDSLGHFTIDELTEGTDHLRLELRCGTGWATIATHQLPAPDATHHFRDLMIDVPAGGVTAGLFDRAGDPLRERMVDLQREDGTLLSFVTDASGTLMVPSLPTGNWAVSLHRNQEPDSRAKPHRSPHRFEITADGHTVLDLHGIR